MAKRRRKLSPEMEKEISMIQKQIELITAKIFDIEDEELQGEYIQGFEPAKTAFLLLFDGYKNTGYNEETQSALAAYKTHIALFESEFEI